MLDTVEDNSCGDCGGYTFGTSPPNRPFVAEGSDLFRAVMNDFKQDSSSRLSRAVVDTMTKNGGNSQTTSKSEQYMCKRCLSDRTLCRCFQGFEKGTIHRVQWVDEIYDKPLAIEQYVTDADSVDGRYSPVSQNGDYVKPILKHRANCIIIVSE